MTVWKHFENTVTAQMHFELWDCDVGLKLAHFLTLLLKISDRLVHFENETEKGTRQPYPFPSLRPAWAGRLLDRPWGGAELPGSKAHSRNSFWETNIFQVLMSKTVILQKCPLKLISCQHENKDNLTSFMLFSDQVYTPVWCKRECLQCIP